MKIILISVFIIFVVLPPYGPTPAKTSNEPQNQTTNEQKKAEPKSNTTTKFMPSRVPLSLSPNTEKEPSNTTDQQNNGTASNWWLIRFSGILAFVAVLQFILAFMQGKWMRSTQRAFVFIDTNIYNAIGNPPPQPEPYPGLAGSFYQSQVIPGPWIFDEKMGPFSSITIKNSGQTPALDVIHWANICIREYPLTSDLPPKTPNLPEIKNSIPTNGIMTPIIIKMEVPLTEEEKKLLNSGNTAIYVYGEVTYRDAFRKKHSTKFRRIFIPKFAMMNEPTEMIRCDEGNETY